MPDRLPSTPRGRRAPERTDPGGQTRRLPRSLLAASWLTIEAGEEDSVLVTVAGSISADGPNDLWSSVEQALEQANGGLVVVDLTRVTGFDVDSIRDLVQIAKASVRRNLDLCALIRPRSPLEHHAHSSGLSLLLPIYACTTAALADTQPPPESSEAGVAPADRSVESEDFPPLNVDCRRPPLVTIDEQFRGTQSCPAERTAQALPRLSPRVRNGHHQDQAIIVP
jgi:anti-anti-sigma regulatory factor